ncbi:MAG: glycogen debranching protein GlgX [Fimbriiglobus sp.]
MLELKTTRGRPFPLGVSRTGDWTNFAVLSRHGTAMTLVIFADPNADPANRRPVAEIALDPRRNRTGDHWHIRVEGLPETFCYGYRVDGPRFGNHRFDPSRVLIDPCATMISDGEQWAGTCEVDPERTSRRSLYSQSGRYYDWQDDAPPLIPHEDTIVYEVHVRGFTQSPTSGVKHPGTFLGLIEKLPYLKELGITAIELLPVHEFDECDCPFTNPDTGEKLVNFWGYNSISFAAPKSAFAATAAQQGEVNEFRDLVRACHQHGIEVFLDVVFNHTGEGDHRGRTYSLRGFDNELYYMLDDHGHYMNYSGCGNTVNCNHPLVRDLILACLHYWVGDMHVDGFRFDLASILGRDRRGRVMMEPPVIEMIAEDGVLADTKLIAEPWDAAGLYQVGGFPYGRRWSEWNGKYRDDVRRFWRGDPGLTSALASRLCGSSDLYEWNGRLPRHSLNFITCHDGFTLNDLVSYNFKHNAANGEENRDGTNDNLSWNGGAEGETDEPNIMRMRERRAKGMMATLMISQGVPMLTAGDEFLRTQQGNNNAWCQDNDISWIDWTLVEKNASFLRFTREMIALRKRHPVFRRRRFFHGSLSPIQAPLTPTRPGEPVRADVGNLPTDIPEPTIIRTPAPRKPSLPLADIHWHGLEPYKPDFSPTSRHLAYSLDGRFNGRDGDPDYHTDQDFYIAMNTSPSMLLFTVPPSPTGRRWHRIVNTAANSPEDILPERDGPPVLAMSKLPVEPFAVVILISEA